MAIRSDSYSSVDEVTAFVRHLLDGEPDFTVDTRPTLTEVEKFIDRASASLNVALAQGGFTPSAIYANAVTKLACDDWVTARVAEYVEMTQRGTGYSDAEGNRHTAFRNMAKSANQFVKDNSLGFVNIGVAQSTKASAGLSYTGLDAQAERSDPSDTSLEQPKFTRGQWDNNP